MTLIQVADYFAASSCLRLIAVADTVVTEVLGVLTVRHGKDLLVEAVEGLDLGVLCRRRARPYAQGPKVPVNFPHGVRLGMTCLR
ncbi:MAG: hypothetical protein ACYDHP_00800 [Ferrimicrobium sp.]